MALQNINALTNAQMWDAARKLSPQFASHTSEATAELFTEKGFDALSRTDVNAINEYFDLSLRIGFQALTMSKARNILENTGLVETYHTMHGGYLQRMAVNSIKPISPGYMGLKDGDVRSPYITRKPEVSERFFGRNFSFQNLISIQDYQIKQVFVSDYGMSSLVAGIMTGLENGYTIQRYENTMELVNAALNSTKYPLQETQVYTNGGFDLGDASTAQVINLMRLMKNIKTNLETKPQSSAFNAMKFATKWDADDVVVLCRAGVRTDCESIAKLNSPIGGTDISSVFGNIVEVDNFGGLQMWTPEAGTEAYADATSLNLTIADLATTPAVLTLPDGSTATVTSELLGGVGPNVGKIKVVFSDVAYRGLKVNIPQSGQSDSKETLVRVDAYTFEINFPNGASHGRMFAGVDYVHGIQVYPVYDETFGSVVEGKYAITEGGEAVPAIIAEDVTYVDPNEDVLMVIAQRGLLFEDIQNEMTTQPIYNPRTLCTNYWMSQPETGLAFDPVYGCIVIKK